MSLESYLSDSRRLDNDRVKHCLNLGTKGEDLFRELTKAIKTDVAEDKPATGMFHFSAIHRHTLQVGMKKCAIGPRHSEVHGLRALPIL